ncbi:MAG: Flp family type IVb pilin [Clostridiales bacterium]|nr:Flp family type IVb pilin [Clostridiales bacterium]MCF8022670.1 Flp family type IVb pilin [Clostridiales bacterium]
MLKFVACLHSYCIFLNDRAGTPSIETAGIIAFVAIAILAALGTMGDTIQNVFSSVTSDLQDQINGS